MTRITARRLGAEAFGTFCLVFAGTGAIIVNGVSGGAVTHVGVALVFGLIVMTMIYAVGDVSGAHLNPAVSLGFVAAGRLGGALALGYILAQTAGAVLASVVLSSIFPGAGTLGQTVPAGAAMQSFVLELILTLILMVVILGVATGAKEKGVMAGVAVGGTIALEALMAGPISGASMNPARSLAPALLAGQSPHLWVYLAAPVVGAVMGAVIGRLLALSRPEV